MAYILSIHTAHTSYPLHLLHFYPPIPDPQTFTYGISDPTSPSYESSTESVTPKRNPIPRNNPPNFVPNVPADPDSDQILSDSSSSNSFKSSHVKYTKQIQRMEIIKIFSMTLSESA